MPDPPSRLSTFLTELKRRRVYRVAAVYAGVAFVIFEIIDATFDYLRIPEGIGTVIIVLLAIGFPVAVGMAWAFDLTEEGLVKTKPKQEAAATKAPHPIVGNKSLAFIAVLAIAFGVWALLRGPSQPSGTTIRSIAVLPLENQMFDPNQEIFVDGMHDALTGELSMISTLRVIGRTSTMSYKDNPKPIPEIARELDVDAVIEGSVFRYQDEDSVRITAQLIATRPERHLKTIVYVANMTDILSLQRTVTRAIVEEIGLILSPEEEIHLASAPQVNREAHDLYLQGRYYREHEGVPRPLQPVEFLEQSIALDSTFAPAWAILSFCYFPYGTDQAKRAADKALELDPDLSVAHVALGLWQVYNLDWDGAEESFQKALELDPLDNWSYYEYGLFLSRFGRYDEALDLVQRFRENDPFNPQVYRIAGDTFMWIRDYEKQLEYRKLQASFSSGASDFPGIEYDIFMQQEKYAEAAVLAEQAWGDSSLQFLEAAWEAGNQERVIAIRDSLQRTGWLAEREQADPIWAARFYIILDERETALDLLEVAQESSPHLAPQYYSVLGEREKALDLLEQYYENFPEVLPFPNSYGYSIIYLIHNKNFDTLRGEPRFKALLRQLDVPEVFDENGQLLRPLPEGF